MSQGLIHIALTFDDRFWAPAYATMRSVCLTTLRRKDLVFHLLHIGLSAAHRLEIEAISTEFGAKLIDYDLAKTQVLDDGIAALRNNYSRRFSPVIYARLFLPQLLPKTVNRVLYLDSDLFVRTSVETLYDIDFAGSLAAAVSEPYKLIIQSYRDLKAKPHFDTAKPYFNSGVILFDLQACRCIDFVAEAVRQLTPEELEAIYYDQDILNIALAGRWLALDWRWNFQNPKSGDEHFDPKIVHYTLHAKPWKMFWPTAFKRTYRHLMTNRIYYAYRRERIKLRLLKLIGR